jgi:hypothetical protein
MGVLSSDDCLARGQAALRAAGWVAARDSFTAALSADPTPEAYDGLGISAATRSACCNSRDRRS